MIKLIEKNIEIRVREDDKDIADELLSECEADYSRIMEEQTNRVGEYECKLSVIDGNSNWMGGRANHWLTESDNGLCGGVILYAHNRKIVCNNTLEDRLNLCFEQELPTIRSMLFTANADGSL
jgi:vacuolar-type H+-ATPase subunit E/Vma4